MSTPEETAIADETLRVWAQERFTDVVGARLAREVLTLREEIDWAIRFGFTCGDSHQGPEGEPIETGTEAIAAYRRRQAVEAT